MFDTQDSLNSHLIGNIWCDAVGTVPPVLTCGISQAAENLLKCRPQPGSDEKARWFEIWTILFPERDRPNTPCE
jgi:hypothetical protein